MLLLATDTMHKSAVLGATTEGDQIPQMPFSNTAPNTTNQYYDTVQQASGAIRGEGQTNGFPLPNLSITPFIPQQTNTVHPFEMNDSLPAPSGIHTMPPNVLPSQGVFPSPAGINPSPWMTHMMEHETSQGENEQPEQNQPAEDERENVSVGTNSGNIFSIDQGSIHAESELPVAIDPKTNKLSVTTNNGTPDIILPQEAVQDAVKSNVFSSEDASNSAKDISLTELDNLPVFRINGNTNKKLFGFIPVSFSKTAFVSAQDGSLLQTNESFVSKMLDVFSF